MIILKLPQTERFRKITVFLYSTGAMESGEAAVMGCTKALMASNDTLFNFEDTLGERDDNQMLLSPRPHLSHSSTNSSASSLTASKQDLHVDKTPTNDGTNIVDMFQKHVHQEPDLIDILRENIRQHPLDLNFDRLPSTSKYEASLIKLSLNDSSPPELAQAQQIVNDLSSPEQNKTADSFSLEQDLTFTIDDQKTCVSMILKNNEERISEISEPIFENSSFDYEDELFDDNMKAVDFENLDNSLQTDEMQSLEVDDNSNYPPSNDENDNQEISTGTSTMDLNSTAPTDILHATMTCDENMDLDLDNQTISNEDLVYFSPESQNTNMDARKMSTESDVMLSPEETSKMNIDAEEVKLNTSNLIIFSPHNQDNFEEIDMSLEDG